MEGLKFKRGVIVCIRTTLEGCEAKEGGAGCSVEGIRRTPNVLPSSYGADHGVCLAKLHNARAKGQNE